MAKFRYFAEVDGQTVELTRVGHDGHVSTAAHHFSGLTPAGVRVQAQRVVRYRSNPSRHECDARCINASGRTMNCECSCGGKNHGRGAFMCTSEAA